MAIFTTRLEALESRPQGLENAQILAISSSGEMAVLVRRTYLSHHVGLGTLAELPILGGTPREIMDAVQQADWEPNGTDLAVVRFGSLPTSRAGRTRFTLLLSRASSAFLLLHPLT